MLVLSHRSVCGIDGTGVVFDSRGVSRRGGDCYFPQWGRSPRRVSRYPDDIREKFSASECFITSSIGKSLFNFAGRGRGGVPVELIYSKPVLSEVALAMHDMTAPHRHPSFPLDVALGCVQNLLVRVILQILQMCRGCCRRLFC